MAHNTARLGGAASNVVVAKVAHGLMRMTWTPTPIRDDEAFAAIKTGIDALPPGVKMVLNSAEFYGNGLTTANLELLARFFDKYPGYADRTFISVKGGSVPGVLMPDGSRKNLRRSVDAILRALRGTKRLDLFQPGRLDPNYSIEQQAEFLNEMVKEGKFDYIGLSVVGSDTIRRAHKVMPVAAVEIEVNLKSYNQQTKGGRQRRFNLSWPEKLINVLDLVIATCKELGIAIAAYSPLDHGLLTDHTKNRLHLEGDSRRSFSLFRDDSIGREVRLADGLSAIANRKGITLAQLSIAWVGALGDHIIPLPGSSNAKRTLENLLAGDVELSTEDMAEIAQLLGKSPKKGAR